jgi:outer membrane biosynthesis protein TonB
MKELDEAMQKEGPKVLPAEKPPVEETAKPSAIAKKPELPKPPVMPLINTPKPEANAFQPETHTSNKKGGIDAIGSEDAVNAKSTTMGAYRRQATGAVEKKWHALIRQKLDVVEPGNLTVRFYVNKNGKVEDARITNNRASPLLADVTLEAILMAEIPPIPKELLPVLDRERMEINYDVVIHP